VQLLVGAKKKSNGANDRHSENSIIQAICLLLCTGCFNSKPNVLNWSCDLDSELLNNT
jgi:hypothetical protein